MADDTLIRTVLARECDTVNEYLELAARAQSEEVRALLLHLAEEEKEHIAVCVQTLTRLDPEQAVWLSRPHEPVGTPADSAAPVSSAPVSSAPVSSAPVSSAPVTSAPVTSAPVTSAPVTSSAAPAPDLRPPGLRGFTIGSLLRNPR